MKATMNKTDAFIFMKVGDHAGESWDTILERKNKEYKRAGMIFWGYGGTACHPINQVQPFAKIYTRSNGGIYLLMQTVTSNADPDIAPATEYSEDGITWKKIPKGISVLGSRYALVLGEIEPGDLEINLNEFSVGIGPSKGKSADQYLQGRIDKGCLVTNNVPLREPEQTMKTVKYSAQLLDPFAVILR